MYTIKIDGSLKGLTWSSGHYVPDNEKCRNFHGHDYSLDIILRTDNIAANGMVIDFTILKDIIKPEINRMDHKFIVPEKDISGGREENTIDIYVKNVYRGTMKKSDIFIFPYPVDSAEYIALYFHNILYNEIKKYMENFSMKVVVHEGPGNIAEYEK